MKEQDIQSRFQRQRILDRNREGDHDHEHDHEPNDRDYGQRDRYTGYRSLDEQRDYPLRDHGIVRGQDIDRLSGPRGGNRRPEFGDLDRDGNYVGERSRYADRYAHWDDRRFSPDWGGGSGEIRPRRRTEGPSGGQFYGEGRGDHAGRGPRGYMRSDERIRDEVCDALTRDSMLDASEMDVRVEGGEVTLEGVVSDRDAKRRAEDIAESISGVQEVTNKLKMKSRMSAGQTASMGKDLLSDRE